MKHLVGLLMVTACILLMINDRADGQMTSLPSDRVKNRPKSSHQAWNIYKPPSKYYRRKKITDKCDCTHDFCCHPNIKCKQVEPCPAGTIYSSRGGGYCGRCPSCIKFPKCGCSKCPPNICDRSIIDCPYPFPCPPGTVLSPRGGGRCGCCPTCISITKPPRCCGGRRKFKKP